MNISEYREGDTIVASKGDNTIGGKLGKNHSGLALVALGWGLQHLLHAGFDVEIVERAMTPAESVVAAAKAWAERIDSPIESWGDAQDMALLNAVNALLEFEADQEPQDARP